MYISLALLFLFCGAAFPQAGHPFSDKPEKTPAGFEAEIAAFLKKDSTDFPPPGAYLFTGSSTIRMWNDLAADFRGIPVIQRGFGGSTMKALNHYIADIVLPYKPMAIVVYEGDNDLAEGTGPPEFLARCDTFINRVHRELPNTLIYFISVKPSFARIGLSSLQDEANRQLMELTRNRPNTGFIDIRPLMYDREGKLRRDLFENDSLHINAECYRRWASQVRAALGIPE